MESLTQKIIGAAIEVHRRLGPGLLENVHVAQLLTYLRLLNLRRGLLLNFNVPVLKEGIKRVSNQKNRDYSSESLCDLCDLAPLR